MQNTDPADTSPNSSQDPSTKLPTNLDQRQESTSYHNDNVENQNRQGAENNGLGIRQGSWNSQMQLHGHHNHQQQQQFQHHQYQPLVQQYNQMAIGPQEYPLYHHHPMIPQYVHYQPTPVQYGTHMMHQYPSQPHPQSQYDGIFSHSANLQSPVHQSSSRAQTTIQHSSAITTTPTSRQQQIKSPRQQFSDTLKRGIQSFDYKSGSTLDEAPSLIKSPSTTQGSSSLPARPDSAIRASHFMQNEIKGANDGNTVTSKGEDGVSTLNQQGPSRPAPTIPLVSRFPPLPPKPSNDSDATDVRSFFEKREEALMLRIEALGFQPEAAWQLFDEEGEKTIAIEKNSESNQQGRREAAAPILGIRLLQKLDQLQRENEELLELFKDKLAQKSSTSSMQDDKDVLLQALDTALSETKQRAKHAEEKIVQLEQALAVACEQNSTAMISNAASPQALSSTKTLPWKPAKTSN